MLPNDDRLKPIVEQLSGVQGLRPIAFLNENQKQLVNQLEEKRNKGVFESLDRKHTLLLTHDSFFRNPTSEIVEKDGEKIIFPGISFPEVDASNVVSSSPSFLVHRALVDGLRVPLRPEEATLLIGFDL